MLKWIKKLLPSQKVTDQIFARFKGYRKWRGGAWYKVSDRVAPKKSMWMREVKDPAAYYVWIREIYD